MTKEATTYLTDIIESIYCYAKSGKFEIDEERHIELDTPPQNDALDIYLGVPVKNKKISSKILEELKEAFDADSVFFIEETSKQEYQRRKDAFDNGELHFQYPEIAFCFRIAESRRLPMCKLIFNSTDVEDYYE